MKTCSRCRQELPSDTDHFHECSSSPDGLQYYCTDCMRAYQRQHYRYIRDTRYAMWHGRLAVTVDIEKLADQVRADRQAQMTVVRQKPKKRAPNVRRLLEQLEGSTDSGSESFESTDDALAPG